jgi:predicted transcriptional regulator
LKTLSKKETLIKTISFLHSMGKEMLHTLLDSKKSAILRFVLNNTQEFYLSEVAKKSNVSVTSTFRILQELVEMKILEKRQWKTSKVYSCIQNKEVTFLQELFNEQFDGVNTFLHKVSSISTIENIILHGTSKKNKANVLLIGANIPEEHIKQAVIELKEEGFELSYLCLARQQYEQMAKMGLYSGEKKVLR